MRLAIAAAVAALGLPACAELGVISDGTSISVGTPSHGALLDGKRLPNSGEGFTTRDVWRTRGNRYGTDELLDLLTGVGRRLAKTGSIRLVVADLSSPRGGAAHKWHRSHQTGRDVDLVYFVRDKDGKPVEADAMRRFDRHGRALDGSGLTFDVPRMWELVKALVTAPEADVQWAFLYEPLAQKLLDYARTHGEPEELIARARLTLRQPSDSALHNDHMHVRIYCSDHDLTFGCVDIGPRELLLAHQAERRAGRDLASRIAALALDPTGGAASATGPAATPSAAAPSAVAPAAAPAVAVVPPPTALAVDVAPPSADLVEREPAAPVCTAAPSADPVCVATPPAAAAIAAPIAEPPGNALLRLLRAGFHPRLLRGR